MIRKSGKKAWVPEIYYEEGNDGMSSQIPFIQVPKEEEMPKFIFIFESRETGEVEPGPKGEELPVTEMTLHQYADMEFLKLGLSSEEFDNVRKVLGLQPLKEASEAGSKITSNIREKLTN
jgi:hypothetical protein